jgi:hypothetical protein
VFLKRGMNMAQWQMPSTGGSMLSSAMGDSISHAAQFRSIGRLARRIM